MRTFTLWTKASATSPFVLFKTILMSADKSHPYLIDVMTASLFSLFAGGLSPAGMQLKDDDGNIIWSWS